MAFTSLFFLTFGIYHVWDQVFYKAKQNLWLSEQNFDVVASRATKGIDRVVIWFGFQLVQNDSTENIYRFAHTGINRNDIDVAIREISPGM